jgi:beta-N-acetylhexosaminidase
MHDDEIRLAGSLLTVGLRGAVPGDPGLESDLEICARAGVGGVILFDVDVPTYREAIRGGSAPREARWAAPRNILGPGQLTTLVGYLRSRLGDDLVVMVDQEGGEVARLRRERGFCHSLPSAARFAALSGPEQRDAARRQADALAAVGIDVNLAPVVDLAVLPEGPLAAGQRSYGSNPRRVTGCAQVIVEAHRAAGIASCLKHFPGLGSVADDTHEVLPVLDGVYDPTRELAPYRELIQGPFPPEMIMAAHVVWPHRDAERPASRSTVVLTEVLREELGFQGVIATDSLDMGAALDGVSAEAALVQALSAGADALIYAANLDAAEFSDGHPALRLATALAGAVEDGALADGWAEVRRRRERLRRLRRGSPAGRV